MRDVVIIGAGVIGCSIARELSRYRLDVLVLERGNDVATGTSKANSAIIHAGYDAKPGTVKAKMNIEGNPMFDALSKELGFPFRRNGSLILCFDEASLPELEKLKARGEQNGVPGLRVLGREELDALEPGLGTRAVAALLAPTGGIVCPYEMTIALYENASDNGVSFLFGQAVTGLERIGGGFRVRAGDDSFDARVLINAAGTHSDEIHNMLSGQKITIIPRAGQYFIFDRSVGGLVDHTVFQLPNEMGKGVLVTPTVDGNLMIGPTATDLDHKDDVTTNAEEADKLLKAASLTLDALPMREMITAFTGIRAHNAADDFVVGEVPDVPGMIDAAGIESPGLTGAPAIGKHVAELVRGLLSPEEDERFHPVRQGIPRFREMDATARERHIAENPAYGHVVCRCETVTEAEIREAVRRGARDLDGVKRRTRAGMGRCQGGFCSTQVLAILAEELEVSPTEITKFGGRSNILIGRNKAI